MRAVHVEEASRVRARLVEGLLTPEAFRAALVDVPEPERDAWVDRLLGIGEVPEDEADLPRGCVPYLPCPVATVLDAVHQAAVTSEDVFVDVGAGLGRTMALAHLLTGAGCIGLEVQPGLARAGRARAARLKLTARLGYVEGDAAESLRFMTKGTVFFLYCPFGGERLRRAFDDLEVIARTRAIRVCCVDMPPVELPWLVPLGGASASLSVYRRA